MAQHTVHYPFLEVLLEKEYRTDTLKQLAALICPKVPSRKDERIQAIKQAMYSDLQGIFNKLPVLGQHAVSETVHTWNGTFQLRIFVNKYQASPWEHSESSAQYRGRGPELLELFLLQGHMPSDLLDKLRRIVPKPPKDTINYTDNEYVLDRGFTVRETSRAALANLATLLTLTEDKEIRISAKTGRATAATMKKIAGVLYEPDWYDDEDLGPMQPFAWPLLLQGGGLAKPDGSSLALTPAGRKALQKDLPSGIQKAWQRWEKTKIIDEFSKVTAIKGQKSNGGRTMTSPVKRRPKINALLQTLQPGKWISIDEFNRLQQASHEYSFAMVNYDWKLYFLNQQYGHLDYHDTWPLLQLRYTLIYLFEYCATLGLIDVAYQAPYGARSQDYRSCWGADDLEYLSHCDGLEYIRINDLGAFVLGHADEYQEQKPDADIFSFEGADLVIQNPTAIAPGQELYLEKIAERTEVDRWRLSVSSLLKALSNGESLQDIRKTLATLSGGECNNELKQLFFEVEHRSTAFVNAGNVTLIKCSSEARNQALTNSQLSKLCMPAGEEHLVAIPGKEDEFLQTLETAGYILGSK